MACEEYDRLKREHESAMNDQRLFKTSFCAGGTKKERAKASQELQELGKKAATAFVSHQQSCEKCKKE